MKADDRFGIWPPCEAFYYIEGMFSNAGSALSSAHIAMRELGKSETFELKDTAY